MHVCESVSKFVCVFLGLVGSCVCWLDLVIFAKEDCFS